MTPAMRGPWLVEKQGQARVGRQEVAGKSGMDDGRFERGKGGGWGVSWASEWKDVSVD